MPSPRKTRSSSKKQHGPVRYRVMGESAVHERYDLEEFLASAVSHKWMILLQVPELPPGPNAWCPYIQPTLLEKGELSKQLQATNCLTKLVVADESAPIFERKIGEIMAAESAFIHMQNLLEKEEGLPDELPDKKIKKKKKKKQTWHKVSGKGREEDVQMVEDVLLADEDSVEATQTMKTQSSEGQPSCKKDDADDFFLEDGKIVHNGKQLSGLEMMVQLLKGQEELRKEQKELRKEQKELQQNLQKDLQTIRHDIKEVNKSLSSTAERVSRLSLALLHGQYTGARIEYPVTTRWIPYNPVAMNTQALENLAVLYEPLLNDTTKGKPSGLVEIDILIKIFKEDTGHKVYTSPMTMKTSRLLADRPSTFTHIVLGESSRSMHLCASAAEYQHPQNPCRTPSAKLLKKLVQVERGIVATLFYYDAPGHGALVDAAAVISPSFRQLTDPDSLLLEVLACTQGALPNVSRLASERRMWLIDA